MGEAFTNEVWTKACEHFSTMERSQEIPMLCRAILAERQRCADLVKEGCGDADDAKAIQELIASGI